METVEKGAVTVETHWPTFLYLPASARDRDRDRDSDRDSDSDSDGHEPPVRTYVPRGSQRVTARTRVCARSPQTRLVAANLRARPGP